MDVAFLFDHIHDVEIANALNLTAIVLVLCASKSSFQTHSWVSTINLLYNYCSSFRSL